MKRKKSIGSKRGIRPFGLPTWALGLALLVVFAAAGVPVGPVLNGSLTGKVGLTVEQSVVLGSGSTITDHLGDNSLVVTNDEGTSFTAAIEIHVGDGNWSLNLMWTTSATLRQTPSSSSTSLRSLMWKLSLRAQSTKRKWTATHG
jgi:hypothetical protein